VIDVVGVGLHPDRLQRDDGAQVVGQLGGAGVEDGGQGGVPDGPVDRLLAIGHHRAVAADVAPLDRQLAGQQVAGGTMVGAAAELGRRRGRLGQHQGHPRQDRQARGPAPP
jgi:hypothetical protein